jgi:hypothetical protein
MTKEEFWVLFDPNQNKMRALVEKYHPTAAQQPRGLVDAEKITAPLAEAACEVVRSDIRKKATELGVARFDQAVESRNAEMLVRVLNETWFGMPETMSVRSEPGFGVLCDLCEGLEPEDDDFDETAS